MRLGHCESCPLDLSRPAKYKCPACATVSCSLPCVQSHKNAKNCSGVRNRAAPVRKRDFDENVFMSDYTFLEDVARATRVAERGVISLHTAAAARSRRAVLAREAASRSVHLYLMPQGFSRRARNTSHVRGKRDRREVYWHVDVIFKDNGCDRCIFVDTCAETSTVESIVLGARNALKRKRRKGIRRIADGPSTRTCLADALLDELNAYIRNEQSLGTQDPDHIAVPGKAVGEDDMHRYLCVHKGLTLEDVLKNRIIIEFPVLYVARSGTDDDILLANARMGVFEKPEPDSESSDCESVSSAADPSGCGDEVMDIPRASKELQTVDRVNHDSHDLSHCSGKILKGPVEPDITEPFAANAVHTSSGSDSPCIKASPDITELDRKYLPPVPRLRTQH